jgi:hypothetical protein
MASVCAAAMFFHDLPWIAMASAVLRLAVAAALSAAARVLLA